MATALKRGTTWQARWEAGRDADGKRVVQTKGGFRVRKAPAGTAPAEAVRIGAIDYAQAQERAIGEGTYVEPAKVTVAGFMERWLRDYVTPRTRVRTLQGYQAIIKRYVDPTIGNVELQRLRPDAIQGLYASLGTGWTDAKGPHPAIAPRSILHVHRVLKQALAWAVRWQLIARNPAEAVAPPEAGQHQPVVLTPDIAGKLLAAVDGTSMAAPVRVALSTGLRRGELLALRWQDVDLDARCVTVNASVQVVVGQGLQLMPPKTARSRRRVALSPDTVAVLRQHRAEQLAERLRLGELWRDEGWVFTGHDGRMARPDYLTQRFADLARAIGAPGLRFHDLRHGHASFLLLGGIAAKVVSERLGHANIGITLDVYSHVLGGMDEQAAATFDTVLRKAAVTNG